MSIPGKEAIVYTSSEINTGVTDGVNVAITRQEESMKTILHELYHFYDMDYRDTDLVLERSLIELFNINNKLDSLNIFEAQTEVIASIINIIVLEWFKRPGGSESTSAPLTKSGLLDMIIEPLTEQVSYSIYKMVNIMLNSSCRSLINNKNTACQITQTTNALSYYIIKVLFYISLDDIANVVDPALARFIKSSTTSSKINDIITKGLKSKLLASILNYMLNDKHMLEKVKNDKSARMTCHG
jgi:hypothetical protein